MTDLIKLASYLCPGINPQQILLDNFYVISKTCLSLAFLDRSVAL